MEPPQCVLCDFANEAGHFAVGYYDWLEVKENEKELQKIIDNEITVVINWPSSGTAEPRQIKKHLSSATWTKCVVRILGFGGWVDMCRSQKSWEKRGKAEITKKERATLCKKNKDPDYEYPGAYLSEKDDEEAVQPIGLSARQKSKTLKAAAKLRSGVLSQQIQSLCSNEVQEETISDFSTGPEHNTDNIMEKLSKTQLVEKIEKLQEKYEECLKKNILLEKLVTSHKDQQQISAKLNQLTLDVKQILKDVTQIRQGTNPEIVKYPIYDPKIKDDCDNKIVILDTEMIFDMDENSNEEDKEDKGNEKEIEQEQELLIVDVENPNNYLDEQKKYNEKEDDKNNEKNSNEISKSMMSHIPRTKEEREENVRYMKKTLGDLCRHDTIDNLINDAFTKVFSKDELKKCSYTGGKCNAQKKSQYKMPLDFKKIARIEDYVASVFKDVDFVDVKKLVKKKAQAQCNNATPKRRDPDYFKKYRENKKRNN